MERKDLIEAKEILLEDEDYGQLTYILSKFPAVAGREIICKYPLSAMPKLGDYAVNEETMLKLMTYVAVPTTGDLIQPLSTRALIDNHVKSFEILMKLEMAMIEYNCRFFRNGRISSFLKDAAQKLPKFLTQMLTDSLERLSQKNSQPTKNLKQPTASKKR